MRKIIIGLLALGFIGAGAGLCRAADDAAPPAGDQPATAAASAGDAGTCCKAGDTTPPLDLVKANSEGGLAQSV